MNKSVAIIVVAVIVSAVVSCVILARVLDGVVLMPPAQFAAITNRLIVASGDGGTNLDWKDDDGNWTRIIPPHVISLSIFRDRGIVAGQRIHHDLQKKSRTKYWYIVEVATGKFFPDLSEAQFHEKARECGIDEDSHFDSLTSLKFISGHPSMPHSASQPQ